MSHSFTPKVSIVIPVYRGEDYLREAIDSALAQTYPNIEVVVVNDGSNDEGATERIALSYGDRIRYFSKPNGGVATALNMATEQMTGEYFSWLSHDDLYVPEKVATQVAYLATLTDEARARAVVYSDYSIFTTDANDTTLVAVQNVSAEDFRYRLTLTSFVHGCTLLIPKAAFAAVGTFDAALRTTQDYDLWFRMAVYYDFYHIPEALVKARSHAAQGTVALSDIAKKECDILHAHFTQNLTQMELLRSHASVSIAYARIANSMWYRGFTRAGWAATVLMLKHFSRATWSSNLAAARMSLVGMALCFVMPT
ncbi:MAG: glycosyltransferase, partial [Rickettsiales bacterium]|nr:glycosyltransferase [Rickettsiales bacterium]